MIGTKIIYMVDGLKIHCTVTATKNVYGRTLYRLEPIKGSGHKWTSKKPGKELEVIK
jgi:hypothetical protein